MFWESFNAAFVRDAVNVYLTFLRTLISGFLSLDRIQERRKNISTVSIWPTSPSRETLEPQCIDFKRGIPTWYTLNHFGCWTFEDARDLTVDFYNWCVNFLSTSETSKLYILSISRFSIKRVSQYLIFWYKKYSLKYFRYICTFNSPRSPTS